MATKAIAEDFHFSMSIGKGLFTELISAALPISSRYLKSTTLVVRNSAQLDALADGMPVEILGRTEQAQMGEAIDRMQKLIAMLSDPGDVADGAVRDLAAAGQARVMS